MASTDILLARLSACASLAALIGLAALPMLPAHKAQPVAAVRPAETQPASPSTAMLAPPANDANDANDATDAAAPAASEPAEAIPDTWTDAEQAAALRECVRLLAPVVAEITILDPFRKGQCGTPVPVRVRRIGTIAEVELSGAPMMSCRLAGGLARWVDTVLQPAAREVLGSRITHLIGASSYSCRHVYNDPERPMSEHATGNAIDIAGFRTADGRRISVKRGWGPTERDIVAAEKKREEAAKAEAARKAKRAVKEASEGAGKAPAETASAAVDGSGAAGKGGVHKAGFKADGGKRPPVVAASAALTAAKTTEATFLKRLHKGACGVFGTALSPEANEAHRDHFHFDMKARRKRSVCH